MTPTRTQVKETDSRKSFQPDMEPAVIPEFFAEVLPSPETLPRPMGTAALNATRAQVPPVLKPSALSPLATLTEKLMAPETWHGLGLRLKKASVVSADALMRTGIAVGNGTAALPWRSIGRMAVKFFKLGIAMFLDLLDFTIGRLLGFGIFFDLGCALITAALWGKRGWWCLLEVLDITEQIDGFIPSCTLIALRSWNED